MLERYGRFDPSLVREWDELADRTGASPFLRPGWFMAWWRAFAKGRLEIFALRRDGELAGVAPLTRWRGGLLSISNWHTPMFGFLVADREDADTLARVVLRGAGHSVTVGFLDEGDEATAQALVRAASPRIRRRLLERSPWIDTRGDWEAYEGSLATRHRRELRRRWRRLEELGRPSFEVHRGDQDLDRLLKEGLAVEGSGWKQERGTSILAQPETRLFYHEVARWAAGRGWLVLGFLRLDGRPVAFDYCLEHDRVHYLLKTGYDPALRNLAPGMLLRREMLRRAYTTSVRTYEFLGGDSPWKLDWTGQVRQRFELRLFPGSGLGRLGWLADTTARPVLGRARRAVRSVVRR